MYMITSINILKWNRLEVLYGNSWRHITVFLGDISWSCTRCLILSSRGRTSGMMLRVAF